MPERPVSTVILTLGNELRGDDYAGILFGQLVRGRTSSSVIEGGQAPENVTSLVAALEPDTILIVDAMEMNGLPGQRIVASGEDISTDMTSTHGTSRLLTRYLMNSTGASVKFLGFQPIRHEIGDTISTEVERSVREAAEIYVSADTITEALVKLSSSGRQEHDRKTEDTCR